MPTVALERDALFERLGKKYTDKEFDELCFEFGVELDEVMTEDKASETRQFVSAAETTAAAPKVLYYIATPANRSDLLCLEGIARGFNIFLGNIPPPVRSARRWQLASS